MSKEKFFLLIKIFLISTIPVFFVWLPFVLGFDQFLFLKIKEGGFQNILRNWDGPSYVVVAKSFYDLLLIEKIKFVNNLPSTYFFTHFPLYPLSIKFLSYLINNLFYSGLIINLIFGFLLNIVFYYFIKDKTKSPLFLTLAFTIFPPRFWVTRSIIAPECLMVLLILSSMILFEKKKFFVASVVGSLGILTKIQSLFLFPAYFFSFLEDVIKKKKSFNFSLVFIVLIPLSLLVIFIFYYLKTGRFFIFLEAEKTNQLYLYYPFSQFNYQGAWAGTGWLEDVVFYFLAMFFLTVSLAKSKNRSWFYFSLFYTLFLVFIPQRDITRFSYPLLPLFYFQFVKFFESRIFKVAFLFTLPALYFYVINFILVNQAPIANWGLLIK